MEPQRRRFSMDRCLGRGGFGEVYYAMMRSPGGLEAPVAVKVLRSDLDLEADAVRRLRDEGKMLARLNHPTILKVYDLVMLEGRLSLITEFVEGADLGDCWTGEDQLPLRGSLQAVSAVASALQAAWETPGRDGAPLRLVHRDVKPTNIRVGRHGDVKLLDFGIARAQSMDREASTASDVVVGSLPYMSPERFVTRDIGSSADVFALGCVLYESIRGERFFGRGHLRTISAMAFDDDKYQHYLDEQLDAIREEVPASVVELLRDTLAHTPSDRPGAQRVSVRCDEIADTLRETSLRIWCRDHEWTDSNEVEGDLEGQTLTEGSLEIDKSSTSLGQPTIRRQPIRTVDPAADRAPDTLDVESDFEPPQMPPGPSQGPSVHDRPYTDDSVPAMFEPTPEPAKRRWWLWGLGGLAGLTLLVAAVVVALAVAGVGVAVFFN